MIGKTLIWTELTALALLLTPLVIERVRLSRAKHRSLAGHARMSRLAARLLPAQDYGEERFFGCDGAPAEIVERRRRGFDALAALYGSRFARSAAATREMAESISDLQFTAAYRVPFAFSRRVRERLAAGSVAVAAGGVSITDLDGNRLFDLGGSYGVNLFGIDFYRDCIERGVAAARGLGPTLGVLHPLAGSNAARLRRIAGLDEVSFHMSGTEAVMQAVRLARYHTRRRRLVRFCGAYHGWWGEVQPGVGNPVDERNTFTLADLSARSLGVLESRTDIACVLINPLQALHPNAPAPGDSSLIDSSRRAGFDRPAYTAWLQRLREVCTRRGIVLIFDEVFVGFRLAPGGAQEYFGVRADMVCYGKTLGGGLPVGALCGRADLMRRFRPERPADICFARGTFNSHPYVMATMSAFLDALESPPVRALYENLDAVWDARAQRLDDRLAAAGLPVRVANLSSIWTIVYTRPSRYNWMLQFYLRAEGLALAWVGTGRLIFSLNYTDADFDEVAVRFVAAARRMEEDGWWWSRPEYDNAAIRRAVLRESIASLLRPGRRGVSGPPGPHARDPAR